jgi:hypothetical protein
VWGASSGAGLPFIGRRRCEGPGCLSWPTLKELHYPGLKVMVTRGVERGDAV